MNHDQPTESPLKVPWYRSIRVQMALAFSLLLCAVLLAIQYSLLYGIPQTRYKGSLNAIYTQEFETLNSMADSRKLLIQNWLNGRRNNARMVSGIPAVRLGRIFHDPQAKAQVGLWLEQLRSIYQLDAVRLLQPHVHRPLLTAVAPAYTGSGLSPRQLQAALEPGMDESIHLVPTPDQQSSRIHIIRQVGQERTSDGMPQLLVEVECDLNTMLKPLLENQMKHLLGESGEILLMDHDRRFLTVTRFAQASGKPVVPLVSLNPAEHARQAVNGGEGTTVGTDYRGQQVLAAFRHIQVTPDVAWGLVVEKDRKEVLKPLRTQVRLYLALGIAGLASTVLLTAVISHRLSLPLRRMVTAARSISAGDLAARVNIGGQAETAELARSFNRMLDQLQSWHEELDYRVRQRTEQLVNINLELQREIGERVKTEERLQQQTITLEKEIAERQKAQEALQALNITLEERVDSTIAELRTKDELLLQQSRLVAMGELLTSIAHQWRQPLNNIAASIQTIQFLYSRNEMSAEEMDQQIRTTMDILANLSHTIDDFRKFFRKDQTLQEFILRSVVERSLGLIRSALTDQGIRVIVEADPSVRAVGHPNEYAQALLNILQNARDVLLERRVADPLITISVGRDDDRSVVSVRDNGGGIDPAILPQIFDPYFTTKGPAAGTGIGLYMARILIERNMGGTITAANVDHGADFRIIL